ncbi:hypothetical protein D3C84_403970 [compost metagenome]
MGEAENAVERRADFMAHIGQEFGLDPARFQGLLAGQVQLDVLDFDGFQVLAYVFGGLVDAVLQLFLGILQGAGHAVDARGQFVQLLAAERRQAGFEMAFLEQGHGLLDAVERGIDRFAHAQGEQCGTDQAGDNQQQAGEQAAITAQQHAAMGKLQLDPAQQPFGFIRDHVAGQVAMLAEHRQQVAGGVVAGPLTHVRAVTARCRVEHQRAGVGHQCAVRGEK